MQRYTQASWYRVERKEMEEVAKEDEEEAEEGGRARGGAGEGEER